MPYRRHEDGNYHIGKGQYPELIGSRAQVMHHTAYKTTGNLTKKDLVKNKHGRIVSRKVRKMAKKNNRLEKAGYKTKKGQFGFIKVKTARRRKGRKNATRKMKGGSTLQGGFYNADGGDNLGLAGGDGLEGGEVPEGGDAKGGAEMEGGAEMDGGAEMGGDAEMGGAPEGGAETGGDMP